MMQDEQAVSSTDRTECPFLDSEGNTCTYIEYPLLISCFITNADEECPMYKTNPIDDCPRYE